MPIEIPGRGVITGLFFVLGASGCMGSLDYVTLSASEKAHVVDGRPVYVDHFKVDSGKYPAFKLSGKEFTPPVSRLCTFGGCQDVRQIMIREDDIWEVTHIVRDRYLIQSETYNERQCRYLAKKRKSYGDWAVNIFNMCLRSYDFSIYINPDGEIAGGWELLPGAQKGGAERKVFFDLNPEKNAGWPVGIVFQEIR